MHRFAPALLLAAALAAGCRRPHVLPETPSTLVSPAALSFTAPGAGYDPVPQTLSVFSPQGGPLVLTGVSTTYATGSGWLSAEVAEANASPARVTVQARIAGLASGTYEATLYVYAQGVVDSPRPVHVTLTVPPPRAVASAASVTFIAPVGGANPPPQQVIVTNGGGGTLERPTVSSPYTTWMSATVVGSADPYTIVLQPHVDTITQLGGYIEPVYISSLGAGNTVVLDAALYMDPPRVEASPSSIAFGYRPGGASPAAKEVAVAVRAPARVTMGAPSAWVSYTGYTGVDWLATQWIGSGSSYTLRLQPNGETLASMAEGSYEATVWVGATDSVGQGVHVRLVVSPTVAAIVTPSPTSAFLRVLRGAADTTPQIISVADGLGGALARPTASCSYLGGDPTGWLSAAVSASGAGWSVSVQPDASGLGVRQYDATVHLDSSGATSGSIDVDLVVVDWDSASVRDAMTRRNHTATVLRDGTVLVVGGSSPGEDIWDPATRTFLPGGALAEGRSEHTATLLADGRVVVAGGAPRCCTGEYALGTWEMYEPATGTWRVLRSLVVPRRGHVAAALPDGTVLVAGGGSSDAAHTAISSAEIIDPIPTASSQILPMRVPRRDASAVVLPDGRVLVAGGIATSGIATASAEIFDPFAGTWTLTGSMLAPRAKAALVVLADGRVLAAGGWTPLSSSYGAGALASVEIYDPAKGTWSATGSMTVARVAPAVLLPTGRVLAVAGLTGDLSAATATAETWDPATGIWSRAGDLPGTQWGSQVVSGARWGHAIAVAGGLVFVSGQISDGNTSWSASVVGTGAAR